MNLRHRKRWSVFFVLLTLFQLFSYAQIANADTVPVPPGTPIMGSSQATQEQMALYLKNNNPNLDQQYINNFAATTVQEANIEGVRADVAFALMMKETNFLKYGGTVQPSWNNFGGLGVTGNPQDPPITFPDMTTGIRAVIQHLKAWASTAPLKQAVVDPRYSVVQGIVATNGVIPCVEWLGINDNPKHIGWATDPGYGTDIVNRVNVIKSLLPMEMYIDAPVNNTAVSNSIKVAGWALNVAGLKSVTVQKADGTTLQTIQSNFTARSDVLKAYPLYPAALLPGFALNVDTANLPNGPQTLKVVAVGQNDDSLTKTVAVNVKNAPMRMYIDTGTGTIRGAEKVSGWATNVSGLRSVHVVLQNKNGTKTEQTTTTFYPRTDVAKLYPQYPGNSGFAATVDTSSMPDGTNTLQVTATGQNGDSISQSFNVTINNSPRMYVDQPLNGSTVKGSIVVSGWALNINGLQSVAVQKADGTELGKVTSFSPRTDVAKVYPGYPGNSGFAINLDTTMLPNGVQTLRVVATGNHGDAHVQTVSIKVSNPAMRFYLDQGAGTLRGTATVRGWALNVSGLKSIQIVIQGPDGKAIKQTVTDFYARSDVAKAFPGYTGNSGFSTTLDTTVLSDGAKTLKVTAVGVNGDSISQSFNVTINNSPRMYVDKPLNGSTVKGSIVVSGWALNINGLQSVALQKADGTELGKVTSFSPRTDVAKVYPGYPGNSGFAINLDTTMLPNGAQTLRVVATGNHGDAHVQTVSIKVSNPAMRFYLDQGAGTLRGTATIRGWALNVSGLKSIQIVIQGPDGKAIKQTVTDFYARPDVAKAFPGYQGNSGFSTTLDTTTLSDGAKTLKVTAVGVNGESLTYSAPVTISNSPRMYVDQPLNGSTVKGSIVVSGWALNINGLQSVALQKADGTELGKVTSFSPRTDVAKVYPGYPGNSGFAINLNTGMLSNGVQTLRVVATGTHGDAHVQTISINVSNPGMHFYLDQGAGTIRGTATVRGWALNMSGLKSVQITLQSPNGTTTGQTVTDFYARPDVDKVYPGYPGNSGFSAAIDTTSLTNGANTLIVKATGFNGDAITYKTTVNVDNAPKLSLDSGGNGTSVKTGRALTVAGWSLNISGLKSVTVTVKDGNGVTTTQTVTTFTPRPDIASAYPGYPGNLSGFSTSFDTSSMPIGPVTVTVAATGNNNQILTQTYTPHIVKLLVVLDPGHGGRDPGAVANGLQEKDVNLAVALKLRDILQSRGYDVVMTRTTDTDLSGSGAFNTDQDLQNRVNFVNASNADVFVCIHSNSSSSSSTHYVLGTYFQTPVPSYTYDPIALANGLLSLDLATKVADGVGQATSENDVNLENHAYYVLRYSKIPSTLVELGFLTNPTTAAAMKTGAWQTNAATGIANGISSYFSAHQS